MAKVGDPRADYIAIASRNMAAHGFHGISLAGLARDAGVTKQALLHFFGTKERLYAEVLCDLAKRLCADIETATRPDPADHLLAYFQGLCASTRSDPHDIRLVVRALLDSEPRARTWPLKPYLDRLVDLARRTKGGQQAETHEIIAWLSQVIGMIQYMAISAPATSGMYGVETASEVSRQFEAMVDHSVRAFTQPASA